MSDGQALALMMKKKRAEGSLDMVKKKKKKKPKPSEDLPPPSPTPPPTPAPPPPTPEGMLVVTVEEPNEFFDEDCKAADKELNKDKEKRKVKKVSGLMARLHASVQEIKERYNELDIAELLSKKPDREKGRQARAFVRSQVVKKGSFDKKMEEAKEKEGRRKEEKEQEAVRREEKEKEKQVGEMRK